MQIVEKLPLEDIIAMSNVSEVISKLCEQDELWEKLYKSHLKLSGTEMGEEMQAFATEIGWKNLYRMVFFELNSQARLENLAELKKPFCIFQELSTKEGV